MRSPNLTVSDVEHIISWTSRLPTAINQHWQVNAAGLLYSTSVGFGTLDCYAMTRLARDWVNVGPICVVTKEVGHRFPAPWAFKQATVPHNIRFVVLNGSEAVETFTKSLKDMDGWYVFFEHRKLSFIDQHH